MSSRIPDGTEEYDNEDDTVVPADTEMRRDRRRKGILARIILVYVCRHIR